MVSGWSFVLTYAILTAFKNISIIGLRPSNAKEEIGLDRTIHGECVIGIDTSRSGISPPDPEVLPEFATTEVQLTQVSLEVK